MALKLALKSDRIPEEIANQLWGMANAESISLIVGVMTVAAVAHAYAPEVAWVLDAGLVAVAGTQGLITMHRIYSAVNAAKDEAGIRDAANELVDAFAGEVANKLLLIFAFAVSKAGKEAGKKAREKGRTPEQLLKEETGAVGPDAADLAAEQGKAAKRHETESPLKQSETGATTKISPDEIPTFDSGKFEAWFDKQTPEQLAEYWQDPKLRTKIKNELLGPGGEHEYLMRAEAPKWKEWGVTARELREKYSVALDELDKVTLFKHGRGTRGGRAPGSTEAHNALRKVIQESASLEDFKRNLVPWAGRWLKGGLKDLPPALQ